MAFGGKRQEAKEACKSLLQSNPSDAETHILLARLHGWDQENELSRAEFEKALELKPQSAEVRAALADLDFLAGKSKEALEITEAGLKFDPNSFLLLFRKAKALKNLGEIDAAAISAQRAVDVNPKNASAHALLDELTSTTNIYLAVLSYTHDKLDQDFAAWNSVSASLGRTFQFGSLTARVNYANRFSTPGIQYEIDAYPKLRKGTYVYVNGGFSKSDIYPQYRFGLEPYQSIGSGWEVSAGLRRLWFKSTKVLYYTGSVAKYLGNFYLTLRTNINPEKIGTSYSGSSQVRYYFSDETYATFAFGAGNSTEIRAATGEVSRLESRSASLDGRLQVSNTWFATAGFGYDRTEIRSDTFRTDLSFNSGVETKF